MELSSMAIDSGDTDHVVTQGSVAELSRPAVILQHHLTDGCEFGSDVDGECLTFLPEDMEQL
jgi:hypothetical protein